MVGGPGIVMGSLLLVTVNGSETAIAWASVMLKLDVPAAVGATLRVTVPPGVAGAQLAGMHEIAAYIDPPETAKAPLYSASLRVTVALAPPTASANVVGE